MSDEQRPPMSDELCDELYAKFLEKCPGGLQMKHYVLVDGQPTPEPNFYRWGRFMEDVANRKIDHTVIEAGRERPGPDMGFLRGCPSWQSQQRSKRNRFSFEDAPEVRAQDTHVSTVFIGADEHCLFETMIFGGPLEGWQDRYGTLQEAKTGHWNAVDLARRACRWKRRHRNGRKARKWFNRLQRFETLSRKRGPNWAVQNCSRHLVTESRLSASPFRSASPDILMTVYWLSRRPRTALSAKNESALAMLYVKRMASEGRLSATESASSET